jgi:hypothetical protein
MRIEYDRIDVGVNNVSEYSQAHRYLYRAPGPKPCCPLMRTAFDDDRVRMITEYEGADHKPELVVLHRLSYDCDDDMAIASCPWCSEKIEHVEVARLKRVRYERKEVREVVTPVYSEVPEDSSG